METSMARLSSGKRINSASDDAAGVAISSRLSAEIRGTDQAIRNSLDGQALIDTAEGAHKEIENILQRMREISVQAANDTNDANDRANLQMEMDAMMTEIDRIASVTTWAGQGLMGTDTAFSFQVGTATGDKNQIDVTIKDVSTDGTSVSLTTTAGDVTSGVTDTTANATGAGTSTITIAAAKTSAATYQGHDGTSALATITATLFSNGTGGVNAVAAEMVELINENSAYIAAGVSAADNKDGTFSLTYGTHKAHMLSATAARSSITNIDAAIKGINDQRSELGAISNRLNHTVNNLTNISSNLSAAKGGIEDADFALETTNLAKNQILQQASTAMLAQANASKQNVLSLLQG
jgi:flagellin